MTNDEVIERLCAVNVLLSDIVREQSAIIAQHGIEIIGGKLADKIEKAETENDLLEIALRRRIT